MKKKTVGKLLGGILAAGNDRRLVGRLRGRRRSVVGGQRRCSGGYRFPGQ